MKTIAIEEHFNTKEILELTGIPRDTSKPHGLEDIEERLKDMQDAGVDMQVLSLGPGIEQFDAVSATALASRVNDQLARVIKKYPTKFAGFATIAAQNPEGAAKELERAVKTLGLNGTMIKSNVKGDYLDNPKYWVVFEMATKLGVPIYLHPKAPSAAMIGPYTTYPELAGPRWGFAAEASLHAMRLICSGVFDKYPDLKIILGHLGEAIPFWLWRIDNQWPANSRLIKKPSQYFKNNFYVTTSGMFWRPPFDCCYAALGADKILFAVDYPVESSKEATEFIDSLPIVDGDKNKILHLNAERLLGL